MATALEKKLAIKLLTERLERETGKKVVLRESIDDLAYRTDKDLDKVKSLATQMYNSTESNKTRERANYALQQLKRKIQGDFTALAYLEIYKIFSGL